MESHRIFICIAMLVACAFAVESAVIPENPVAPLNALQPQPENHQREKKWAIPLVGSYAYSGFPYTSYYPATYSALPYYSGYRSYPYYGSYIL